MSNIRRSWPRGIIRYCWLIPLSALLIAGLTYVLDGMKPPAYTAVGRIFLAPNAPANGQQAEDVARTGQTQAKMLTSNVVTRVAAKELNFPEAALTGEVSADFDTEASYITLSVSAPNARDAALRLVLSKALRSVPA